MRIIAVANQKGGSGKTTTAVNLSATLAEKNRRVLLVDLDPQSLASMWLGVNDGGRALFDVLTDEQDIQGLIRPTEIAGVDLVPSSTWLTGLDKALAGESAAETALSRNLQKLPPQQWDYVLIDCPPTLGILAVNALAASGEGLVPLEARFLSLQGLERLLELVEIVRIRLNPALRISGMLACRVDARTLHAKELVENLRARFGDLVYRSIVREDVHLAECPSFKKPIIQYAEHSRGAQDYRLLADEVIEQEGSV